MGCSLLCSKTLKDSNNVLHRILNFIVQDKKGGTTLAPPYKTMFG